MLLRRLALTDPNGLGALDTETGLSVFDRMPFMETALYKAFLAHRADWCMREARQANNDSQRRCELLRAALGFATEESTVGTARVALQLFEPAAPGGQETPAQSLCRRGLMLVETAQAKAEAAAVAVAWDPLGPLGTLAAMTEGAPDLSQISYATFREASVAAAALEASDLDVKNAAVKAAVQLIAGFAAKFGDAPWATGILERAVSARLGLQVEASVLESSPEAAPPDEHVAQAFKLLKPFLGAFWGRLTAPGKQGQKVDERPGIHEKRPQTPWPWYIELKQRAEALAQAQAAKDAEEAEAKRKQAAEEAMMMRVRPAAVWLSPAPPP